MRTNIYLLALILVISSLAFLDNAVAETKAFKYPKIKGYRLDWCLDWGKKCGGQAATAWCRKKGYSRAVNWKLAKDIGEHCTTYVMGSGKLCGDKSCDGFSYITCERPSVKSPTSANCTARGQLSGQRNFVNSIGVYTTGWKRLSYTGTVSGGGAYMIKLPPGKYKIMPEAGGKFELKSSPSNRDINCGAGQSHTVNFNIKGISEG